MTRINADISVSLDGFVTGSDPSPDHGLGTGDEALHPWASSDDRQGLREGTAPSGAGATVGSALDAGLVGRLPVIR